MTTVLNVTTAPDRVSRYKFKSFPPALALTIKIPWSNSLFKKTQRLCRFLVPILNKIAGGASKFFRALFWKTNNPEQYATIPYMPDRTQRWCISCVMHSAVSNQQKFNKISNLSLTLQMSNCENAQFAMHYTWMHHAPKKSSGAEPESSSHGTQSRCSCQGISI